MRSQKETAIIKSKERPTTNSFLSSKSLAKNLWKASAVVLFAFLIGVFDAWQALCMNIGNILGCDAAILYQVVLIVGAAFVAVVILHDRKWSLPRNALSLLVTIPIATFADNVSLDLQVMKPYVVILPSGGYLWRLQVFDHTIFYPLASWVDLQTLAPGLINAYAAAIFMAAAYVIMQIMWNRMNFGMMVHALQASRIFFTHPLKRLRQI